jgi:hypothetical protein
MKNLKKTSRLILGEGEGRDATGQIKKHVLDARSIEYDTDSNGITFMLKSMGILTHDEHAKMVFHIGTYRSYNQVEFNPFDQTVNRVFD